jgi:hypothetical protein
MSSGRQAGGGNPRRERAIHAFRAIAIFVTTLRFIMIDLMSHLFHIPIDMAHPLQ